MAQVYDGIDGRLKEFVLAQPVFFVASAPDGPDGHVNISPKGMVGSFVVLGEHRVAYLDYTGSGAETIAHLRQNRRVTLMFCSFEGPPNIVRLYGHGEVVRPGDPGFPELFARFSDGKPPHNLRSVIVVEVDRVSDSCGFAVPLMAYVGDRDLLTDWASRKTDEDIAEYWATRNATSIDGLPALA